MTNVLFGVGAIVVGFLLYWLYLTIKAMKDPDVQAASSLRMSIKRYHLYKKIYDEYDEFMKVHGTNSAASEKKFAELFKQIPNPNEWRRYQEYRYRLFQEKLRQETRDILGLDIFDNSIERDDFGALFNAMLEHEQNLPDELQRKLKDVMIYSPSEWKDYCISRELDYSPKYKIGFCFNAYNDETGTIISGRIIDIVFDYTWWKYKVDFDDEIPADNNTSENNILLFESQIKGLMGRTIKYSDFLYV